jgi:hypothetical protein
VKKTELDSMVYGHHCLEDALLDEIKIARDDAAVAEPGDWRVRDGRVVRYGTWTPVAAVAALHFLAMCFTWVPRLLKCIGALEDALRSAWVSASSARRELAEERARHVAMVERVAVGASGPASDLLAIVEAIELGGATPQPYMSGYSRPDELRKNLLDAYARKLGAWARGQQIEGDLVHDPDVEHLRRMKADADQFRAEEKERFDADVALARALVAELKLTKAQREAALVKAQERAKRTYCAPCGANFKPDERHYAGCPNDKSVVVA